MKISLIVAYGKNGELGLKNKLLWHIPEDLKNFKKITNGKALFMGRNTYNSIFSYLNKPLQNRTSFVLTNNDLDYYDNVIGVDSFEEALEEAELNGFDELIIIGGASIYEKYFDYADFLYISEVDYEGEADCFFKHNLTENYQLIDEVKYEKKSDSLAWVFKTYLKR